MSVKERRLCLWSKSCVGTLVVQKLLHKHLCLRKRGRPIAFTLNRFMIKALLKRIDALIPVRYCVDGYFGTITRYRKTMWIGTEKLRHTALYFPSTLPSAGRGRPRYGQRFNPQIDAKYRLYPNARKHVYQVSKLRHKKFPGPLCSVYSQNIC